MKKLDFKISTELSIKVRTGSPGDSRGEAGWRLEKELS